MRKYFLNKQNLFLVFSGVFGVVLVWRGMWGLMDTYLFPGHPEISYTLSIIMGMFILLIDDFELEELGSHRAVHGPDTEKFKKKSLKGKKTYS